MNIFTEKLKNVDFGPKNTHLFYFKHNKNFPENIGCVNFTCQLNLNLIQKIFKKTNEPNKMVLQMDLQHFQLI